MRFVALQLGLVVEQMRIVLQPQVLQALGAGSTKISADDHRYLVRFHRLTRCLQGMALYFALMTFYAALYMGGENEAYAMALFLGAAGCSSATAVVVMLDFGLALQVAAILSSDAVLEVVKNVEETSPNDTERWQREVVQRALELEGIVCVLSRGFGRGLAIIFTIYWAVALLWFSLGMIERNMELGFMAATAVFLYIPISLSGGVAHVSTSCDDLMTAINRRRIGDLAVSDQVQRLELALRQLNNMQGLGFTITDGSVLDKRRLRAVFSTVMGIFATVVPILLSLSPHRSDGVIYGQLPGNPKMFAFNPQARSYADGVTFCNKLWMRPASINSEDEWHGMLRLLELDGSRPKDVYLGAEFIIDGRWTPDGRPWTQDKQIEVWGEAGSAPETKPKKPDDGKPPISGKWRWVDGSNFDYLYTQTDYVYNSERSPDAVRSGQFNGHEIIWEMLHHYLPDDHLCVTKIGTTAVGLNGRSSALPMVCSARSLVEIPGAIPQVLNLAPAPQPIRDPNATTCCTLVDAVGRNVCDDNICAAVDAEGIFVVDSQGNEGGD